MPDQVANTKVKSKESSSSSAATRGEKPASSSSKGKGKGNAPKPTEEDDEMMEEDEEDDDDDDDDDEGEEDEDDDEDDEDEAEDSEKVDPKNIIGGRGRRNRPTVDYSSEEAFKNAGLSKEEEDEAMNEWTPYSQSTIIPFGSIRARARAGGF